MRTIAELHIYLGIIADRVRMLAIALALELEPMHMRCMGALGMRNWPDRDVSGSRSAAAVGFSFLETLQFGNI